MNRNDKNKKYTPLNINNVFKGKAVEPQSRSSYKLGGMQNIGKVSSMRRVPPPKWVPSLKAETSVSDNRQIINQSSTGWVNPVSQDNCDSNIKSQGIANKVNVDKSQWNYKISANKPFFLIGQEFPLLQSEGSHDLSQDNNATKDTIKSKESESKSKIDDLRNRDTNISVSTLNRIDALSISKSSKGDIAATGWAAEDEEPNFDEKIIFSDEDSSNEIQNWHSDNEDGTSKSERCDNNRESVDNAPIISDVWHDHTQPIRFQQFPQMPMPINVPGQFITNPTFPPQTLLNRNTVGGTIANIGDEQAAFMNSVAEQRNARNMEYFIAIERARQKKFATQTSRGSCGINDDHSQLDQALMRSRHTSMTSDTADSMNTPIEMGPPGGPPLIHHLHKPHLQPQISPMMHPHNISVISPSIAPQSLIRFTQHPYNIVPLPTVQMDHMDSKLMEKFVEFLKMQSNNEISGENTMPIDAMGQSVGPVAISQDTEVGKTITDYGCSQPEPERPQSHVSHVSHPDKELHSVAVEKPAVPVVKDNNSELGDKDLPRKTTSKSNYQYQDDEVVKYDSSKKPNKNKNFKEYRSNKMSYKGDYMGNSGNDRDYYPENNDDMAYEDYNTYKQHYSRDYKLSSRGGGGSGGGGGGGGSYNRVPIYNHYGTDPYSSQQSAGKDNFSNDYQYKSNSLKMKSSKSKDSKTSGLNTDHCSMERDPPLSGKKYPPDNQDCWPSHESDITDTTEKKSKDKDMKKNAKLPKSSYQPKKYDNRNYKEKPIDSAPQEYSMGFAVNPKDSRKNYYSANSNRRYYTDYNKYYNYGPNNGTGSKYSADYDNDGGYHYQDNSYYSQDYYQYDRDVVYSSSSKYVNKRNPKNSSTDTWRSSKDDKTSSNSRTTNADGSQQKYPNRSNRKSDKRQFSTSKDNNNDNDLDEWETASEGGSVRSNSVPKEVHKSHNRQNNSQINPGDNSKPPIQTNNNENRKVSLNKTGSNYSCNGGNNSFNDNNGNQDGSGGASGSSGGARFFSSTSRSNVSQSRSVDSSQNKNIDQTSNNENRNSDSTSKNCSNNNNSNKNSSKLTNNESESTDYSHRVSSDLTNPSATVSHTDKYSDMIDDQEFLYENGESQFQEVLSKATKKSRKLEEQKRQKEEIRLEQKRLEALKFKSKTDNNQARKPANRNRDQLARSNKCEPGTVHKYENKGVVNIRDKENSSSNTFKKWENNKVSMQIGSWDNSLADEISSEKKVAPPKPIGTPASTVPWNKKVKGSFETNASINICAHSLSNDSIKLPTDIDTISQPFIVSSDNPDVNFNTTTMSYSYNSSIYNPTSRPSEENKIEKSIETQATEIAIHDTINFEYDVKNINSDKNHRNLLSTDRNVQNNDQKLLNDKISSVKTIWDNQPTSTIIGESKVTLSSSINKDLDIHTVTVSINQDVSNPRNIENNHVSPSVPIPNVCKVKPQLQQDFKKDHNEIIITSQTFPFRNSPAAFLSQNQGSFMPYRFPDFLSDPLHAGDAFASLISNNQSGMHINYNLPNPHLIDSSLLRQNTQEQMLSNKMNFINQTQSSFYPQQAPTPKLISNTPAQLPINMDMSSTHGPPHPMQQLLLTRQNSLTSMMQPNPMTIPFIQSGQQPIQAQTPLFPNTPLLGATNFSSQLNPFPQGHLQPHYPHGNFQSLTHTPHFHPNHHHHHQQMLLNQHPHHHHQQQIIQGSLSHDRVINSGQSGVFNSVIGPSDISTNTGLPDFNGQPKPLNHNNIMHGMNGSAFMLPHNLNILMKPSMFATNSQYNNFTAPIQSNLLSLKSGFEHNSNLKSVEMDHFKHDNSLTDRNIYCSGGGGGPGAGAVGDNLGLQKSNDDYYQDVSEYDNCDINYDNWMPNLRYSKVDIYTANNLTFDFHSQKSPMQFSPMEAAGSDTAYRNYITPFRDNQTSLPAALQTNANLQYIISPRIKQQFNQDPSVNMINRQHTKSCYDNQNFISTNNFSDSSKISIKNTSACGGTNSIGEVKDNLVKDVSNIEKSLTDSKKALKQRTSYSDNFDEKNQSWSLIEDDRSAPPTDDNRSSLKSNNSNNNNNNSNNTETSGNSHSPNKPFTSQRAANNAFDNQCQYGYDETQLSSQTAESLRKYDQDQLKKVIMKLREGPVMTDTNCNGFDFTSYKGATIPRLMPLQSARSNKQNAKSFNNYNSFSCDNYERSATTCDSVGLGFYSRNRALTPPAAQFRVYRNKANRNQTTASLSTNSNNNNSSSSNNSSSNNSNNSSSNNSSNTTNNSNSISINNTNNCGGGSGSASANGSGSGSGSNSGTGGTSNVASINRVSRQKCDTNDEDVDSGDLKLNVQSKSLECDNLVLENIIDSPIL